MKQIKNTFVNLSDKGDIHPINTHGPDQSWYDTSVPCRTACPAGTDIPGYLKAIREGDFSRAYDINLKDNVFPAVLGRICTHPCEPACRHGRPGLGEPVSICFSKRSADDFRKNPDHRKLPPLFPANGKSVAVVGGGPAGLSAARDLALLGYQVTVFEKYDKAGGMMVQGIPEFRLPREIVAREVEQVLSQGIELRLGVDIGKDITLTQLSRDYEAVIVSIGAQVPWTPDFEGTELKGVQHGFDFVRNINRNKEVSLGSSVVVVGGGFTAVDSAQLSRYLGAEKVEIVYREGEEKMRCTELEIERMKEEGISLRTYTEPKAFVGKHRVEEVSLKSTAEQQKLWTQAADAVLIATGQRRGFKDLDPVMGQILEDSLKKDDPAYKLEGLNIFACGDARMGAQSVIDAIGDARQCARELDRFLMGESRLEDSIQLVKLEETGRSRDWNAFDRQKEGELPVKERSLRKELSCGLSCSDARNEAWRCYMCHQKVEIDTSKCITCGLCLMAMPVDDCIVQIKKYIDPQGQTRFERVKDYESYDALAVDQDKCIRCNACRESCPVDCISLHEATPVTRKKKNRDVQFVTLGSKI